MGKKPKLVEAILRAATNILGFVLVLTPLALWAAWSEQSWFLVMVAGIVSVIGLLLCHWLTDDDRHIADDRTERAPRPATVSDEFLAELSSMGPFTYHNRLTGDRRFRMKMERLRKLL